jgi:hypothetical protein
MKKSIVPVVAEVVRLHRERGDKSHIVIVRYHPGFKEAYAMIHTETGPVEFAVFGDDTLNRQRLREAWRDWGNDGTVRQPMEWSFKWAVSSFVAWLNSGGEARMARLREARRHGGRA